MKKRKHRVAILVEDLSDYSGVSAVAFFLHRILLNAGRFDPELISLSSSMSDLNSTRLLSPSTWFRRPIETTGERNGVKYRHLGAWWTEFEFQRYRPSRSLTELLDTFDLVQVVCGCPQWGLVAKKCKAKVALQVASLNGAERVSMLNGLRGTRAIWMRLMTMVNNALEPRAIRRADRVFVENHWMYQALNAEYGGQKIVFAPPGVDTEFFQPAEYNERGYLLSVGRLHDPRKNVRLLFDAYRRVRDALDDAPRLVLAGETLPATDDLAYAESRGILPFIEMHQSVSLEKLRTLYQNASLFILTSNEEGLGLVIAEAMACGVPVISTRCGGPETLVVEGETGMMTTVGDARQMSESILHLIEDPDQRRRMSLAARRRAVENFSVEETARVFLKHYDELLDLSVDELSHNLA